MKILVTGSKGFIGAHLVSALRAAGDEVHEYVGDVCEPVRPDFRADVVAHLAGIVRSAGEDSPEPVFATNVVGTANVLRYCDRVGAGIVLASTSAVYGVNGDARPIAEDRPPSPRSPYAMSKWLAEQLCSQWSADSGGSAVALRIFNVYGEGQSAPFIVPHIADSLRQSVPLGLRSPAAIRDFVHVDDVVGAFGAAARQGAKGGIVVNVGSGVGTRIAELAAMMAAELGVATADQPLEGGEDDAVVAKIAQARSLWGWSPSVGLRDGLRRLAAVGSGDG